MLAKWENDFIVDYYRLRAQANAMAGVWLSCCFANA
jgi:hypothetical protein